MLDREGVVVEAFVGSFAERPHRVARDHVGRATGALRDKHRRTALVAPAAEEFSALNARASQFGMGEVADSRRRPQESARPGRKLGLMRELLFRLR